MIKKELLDLRSLAGGTSVSVPVFQFEGYSPTASTAYIQSSIHGSEVQGYMVAILLVEHFAKYPPKGAVTIVPLANPYATNCKIGGYTFGRFDPVTGDNWNRNYVDYSSLVEKFFLQHSRKSMALLVPMFKQVIRDQITKALRHSLSYSRRLALELQRLAVSADTVLDLHCDTRSVPHVYSPSYASSSVEALGLPFIIELDNVFAGALDEAVFCPWTVLTEAYNSFHSEEVRPVVEAFTVELGAQERIDMSAARLQAKSILKYLATRDTCVPVPIEAPLQSFYKCHLSDFLSVYSPTGGFIVEHAPLGVPTPATKPLVLLSTAARLADVEDLTSLIQASSKEIALQEEVIPLTLVESAVVHEGMLLMKVMRNYRKVSLS